MAEEKRRCKLSVYAMGGTKTKSNYGYIFHEHEMPPRSLGYREKENERRRRIETAKEMHDTHLVEWTDVLCSGVGFKVLQNHGFDNQSRFRGLLFGRRSRRLWRWCWRRRLFVVVDVQFRHLCLFSLRAQQQQQQRQQQKRVFWAMASEWAVSDECARMDEWMNEWMTKAGASFCISLFFSFYV